jgi:hypothetical protein
MLLLGVYFLLGLILCSAWYWFSLRRNRRKAGLVLRWIETALAGQGHVRGIRWVAPSRFKVPLQLTPGVFHNACLVVELSPSEMPIKWLLSKVKKQQDMIVFQADLDCPPSFSLNVNNFRWFARSSGKTQSADSNWTFEQTGPFVISSRMTWQKEVACTMTSLASSSNREFLNISFQRRTPHFSVTLPLDALSPDSPTRGYMFENMRELATSSSASLS